MISKLALITMQTHSDEYVMNVARLYVCALLCGVAGHLFKASLLDQHSSGVPPMNVETSPIGYLRAAWIRLPNR